jgi:hypothetical protein
MFALQRDEEGKLSDWKKHPRELVNLEKCRGILPRYLDYYRRNVEWMHAILIHAYFK